MPKLVFVTSMVVTLLNHILLKNRYCLTRTG